MSEPLDSSGTPDVRISCIGQRHKRRNFIPMVRIRGISFGWFRSQQLFPLRCQFRPSYCLWNIALLRCSQWIGRGLLDICVRLDYGCINGTRWWRWALSPNRCSHHYRLLHIVNCCTRKGSKNKRTLTNVILSRLILWKRINVFFSIPIIRNTEFRSVFSPIFRVLYASLKYFAEVYWDTTSNLLGIITIYNSYSPNWDDRFYRKNFDNMAHYIQSYIDCLASETCSRATVLFSSATFELLLSSGKF